MTDEDEAAVRLSAVVRHAPVWFVGSSDGDWGPRTKEHVLEISWTRTAGSALGAVSAAVLLSTLGVAGTLLGAALGSLVITVGGAMYSSTLQATHQRVRRVTEGGIAGAGARARRPDDDARSSGRPAPHAASGEGEASSSTSRAEWLHALPWKRIIAASVAVFVVAMGLILAFELTTGRAVSSYTGGSNPDTVTSVPGFKGRSDSGTGTDLNPDQQNEVPQDTEQEEAPQEQEEVPQDPQPQDPQPQDPQPQEAPPQEEQAPPEAPPADPEP